VDREFVRQLVGTYQSRTTPTLVVGETVVIGFQPDEYEAALAGR
jgi:protein-disulfide isomerase